MRRTRGRARTNLTVADRWGNVVEYTFTIEQIGGNAMVVPGRGFLLNNELTDFNFTPTQGTAADPNLPAAGKRPRSSMAPTIVLHHGKPWLAVGSPGGSTIITTVLQILVNRIDFGLSLPEAIAAAAGVATQLRVRHRRACVHQRGRWSDRARPYLHPDGRDRRRHRNRGSSTAAAWLPRPNPSAVAPAPPPLSAPSPLNRRPGGFVLHLSPGSRPGPRKPRPPAS